MQNRSLRVIMYECAEKVSEFCQVCVSVCVSVCAHMSLYVGGCLYTLSLFTP